MAKPALPVRVSTTACARTRRHARSGQTGKTPATREEIRAFLAGESEGGALWHALYDHILDEPVPERLRTALKR